MSYTKVFSTQSCIAFIDGEGNVRNRLIINNENGLSSISDDRSGKVILQNMSPKDVMKFRKRIAGGQSCHGILPACIGSAIAGGVIAIVLGVVIGNISSSRDSRIPQEMMNMGMAPPMMQANPGFKSAKEIKTLADRALQEQRVRQQSDAVAQTAGPDALKIKNQLTSLLADVKAGKPISPEMLDGLPPQIKAQISSAIKANNYTGNDEAQSETPTQGGEPGPGGIKLGNHGYDQVLDSMGVSGEEKLKMLSGPDSGPPGGDYGPDGYGQFRKDFPDLSKSK